MRSLRKFNSFDDKSRITQRCLRLIHMILFKKKIQTVECSNCPCCNIFTGKVYQCLIIACVLLVILNSLFIFVLQFLLLSLVCLELCKVLSIFFVGHIRNKYKFLPLHIYICLSLSVKLASIFGNSQGIVSA